MMVVMAKKRRGQICEPRRSCDTCVHSTYVCDNRHRCQAFGKIVTASHTCEDWMPMPVFVDRGPGERMDADGEERRWVTELFGAMVEPRHRN